MRAATAHVSASATAPDRSALASRAPLQTGREEVLLNLDLSDLVLPEINDLQVDGLKSSWLSRLLGKR